MQYAAGTGELVLDAISSQISDIDVSYRDDSAVIFDSAAPTKKVGSLPFAKNIFVVLAATARGSIDKGVQQLGRTVRNVQFPKQASRVNAFRTMIHVDGELSSVGKKSKSVLERELSSKTGARLQPRGKCQEYWVIGRVELRELLLCLRLPKPSRPPKMRGAISYELSAMLVHASHPRPGDSFLDPFAGSGSFVQARLELPAHEIWYSDWDLHSFRQNFPHEMTADKRIGFMSDDALSLPSLPDGTVDVIVTDPPWGEHEDVTTPYPEFANAMAESFERVLRPTHGRFVVLCSRRTSETISHSLQDVSFNISSAHSILVNGHPATVLIGGRPKS